MVNNIKNTYGRIRAFIYDLAMRFVKIAKNIMEPYKKPLCIFIVALVFLDMFVLREFNDFVVIGIVLVYLVILAFYKIPNFHLAIVGMLFLLSTPIFLAVSYQIFADKTAFWALVLFATIPARNLLEKYL
jgi:hypothetical protein